jgi:hypothetical protein
MMKNTKKTYIAPSAELILLAPLEALANQQTLSTGDQIALNKWGKNVFSPASVTSKRTYWAEDGKIYPK